MLEKPRAYKNVNSSEARPVVAVPCLDIEQIVSADKTSDGDAGLLVKLAESQHPTVENVAEKIAESMVNEMVEETLDNLLGEKIGHQNTQRVAELIEDTIDPVVDKIVDIVEEDVIEPIIGDIKWIVHPNQKSDEKDEKNGDGYFTSVMKFLHIW